MHTLVPWRPGLDRNTPDRWKVKKDKIDRERAKGGDTSRPPADVAKQSLAGAHHGSWLGRGMGKMGEAAKSLVPQMGGARLHFNESDDLSLNLAETGGVPDTNTSTLEQHYFHFDEIWHCLYNRMEMSNLQNPDNQIFKSEDARKRQINNFTSIMSVTKSELQERVTIDVDNTNSAKVTVGCACTCSARCCLQPLTLSSVHACFAWYSLCLDLNSAHCNIFMQPVRCRNIIVGKENVVCLPLLTQYLVDCSLMRPAVKASLHGSRPCKDCSVLPPTVHLGSLEIYKLTKCFVQSEWV